MLSYDIKQKLIQFVHMMTGYRTSLPWLSIQEYASRFTLKKIKQHGKNLQYVS